MAIYRQVQMSFWTDTKVADDFTPEDKYFYLYLFTNPHTNLCGCYEISLQQISNETGYNKDSIERLINRMETTHGVIRYSKETKELLILKWHKYNWTKSQDFRKPLLREIEAVKRDDFRQYLMSLYDGVETVPTPSGETPETTVTVTVNNNLQGVKEIQGDDNNILNNNIYISKPFQNDDPIAESELSSPLKEKLQEWVAYKKERREPYKPIGLKAAITQVKNAEKKYGTYAVVEAIDYAMSNGWKGMNLDRLKTQNPAMQSGGFSPTEYLQRVARGEA